MTEDMTCDYARGQPRCGKRGFREVWKTSDDGTWSVLCYGHFVQEKKLGHLAFWGEVQSSEV